MSSRAKLKDKVDTNSAPVRGRRPRRPGWKRRVLDAVSLGLTASAAARRAGIHRSLVYRAMAEDAEFAREYDEAWAIGADAIRDEVYRRAIRGVRVPVFQRGERVGYVTRYSDTLLALLAKARLPEFREPQRRGFLDEVDDEPHSAEPNPAEVDYEAILRDFSKISDEYFRRRAEPRDADSTSTAVCAPPTLSGMA